MKSITTKIPLPAPRNGSANGVPELKRRRAESQPVITPQKRKLSTEQPSSTRAVGRGEKLPAEIKAFHETLKPILKLDRQTMSAILSERTTELKALIGRYESAPQNGTPLIWNVLIDLKWLVNNLEGFLSCFRPDAGAVPFEKSLESAHREQLVRDIGGIFVGLETKDQVALIAACEPEAIDRLLSDAKVQVATDVAKEAKALSREVEYGKEKRPLLTLGEALTLFDYHNGSTKTFMVSNSAARLAATTGDESFREYALFHDKPRRSAYEKLQQNPYFSGTGDAWKGVKLDRTGGTYLITRLNESYSLKSKFPLMHQQSATTSEECSYVHKKTPPGEWAYSHSLRFEGVNFVKTDMFNNVNKGESEVVILPSILFTVSAECDRTKPYDEYTLKAAKSPRPAPEKTEKKNT